MDLGGTETETNTNGDGPKTPKPDNDDAYKALRQKYEGRLIQANLRTEAVRAGMIDLDGLRMIDQTTIRMDDEGNIIDGKDIMHRLKKQKPWLFGSMSSSSIMPPPSSTPVRQKSAMEMTDEEYASARAALTKFTY